MSTWDGDPNAPGPSRAPLVISGLIVLATALLLVTGGRQLGDAPLALPIWLVLVITYNVITLIVLVAQYRTGAGPRVLALTWAFIWSLVMTAAMLVVVEPALTRTTPTTAEAESIATLFALRHLGVPVLVVLALAPWPSSLARRMEAPDGRWSRVLPTYLVVTGAALALAAVVLHQPSWLPNATRVVDGLPMLSHGVGAGVMVVNLILLGVGCAGIVVRRGGQGLEAWAVVMLAADCGDTVLTFVTQGNHTVAWYGARALGLVGAIAVLGALLREANQLQIRTRRYAEQLATQNMSLTEAQGLRDHLVAVVSHDMRSPLAGLQGYLEVLQADYDLTPAEVRRIHSRSRLLTRRLILLTEDLLASATIDGLQVLPEQVVLRNQIDECVASFPELSVIVHCPPDLEVLADPLRFQQILTNLVRNAQKHGAEPVRIHASRVGPSTCRLSVSDAGPGVDADFLPRLFDRYTRGTAARNHGSGLGLSVARALTERHGGRIDYEPATNEFVLEIPAVPAEVVGGVDLDKIPGCCPAWYSPPSSSSPAR